MRQYNLALEKYWVTQSVYFRLATTLTLGMGIADGKLLLCHGISEGSLDKKIPMRQYNNRTVYDFFNNPFPDIFGSPDFNLPPITIDDIPRLDKISNYTPDMLPGAVYAASEKYVSTFTTPSDSPPLRILTSDGPNPHHFMNKDEP